MLAFTVPLLGAGTLLVTQQSARVDQTQQQEMGLGFLRSDQALIAALRRYREDRRLALPVHEDALVVRTALTRLQETPPMTSGRGIVVARLANLAKLWQDDAFPATAMSRVDEALEMVGALGAFENQRASVAGDASDDPTQLLLAAYGSELPNVGALVDDAQHDLLPINGVVTAPSATSAFRAAVAVGRAAQSFAMAQNEIATAERSDMRLQNEILPSLVRSSDELSSFEALSAPPITKGKAEISRQASRVWATLDPTSTAIANQIERRLQARQADERRRLLLYQVEIVLAVFVTLAMMLLIARTIVQRDRRELARARSDAERLAAELTRQREIDALMMSETQLRAAFDRSSIGVAIIDRDGEIVRSNGALRDMIETNDARLVGASHANFSQLIAGDLDFFTQELEIPNSRGGVTWFESTISLVRADGGDPRFALAMLKDVTERKRAADRLRHEASHDPLSGLPNRSQFVDRLRATFFGGRSLQGVSAVLFVDLDEFKFINDSLGHAIGDRVLVAVSRRLQSSVRDRDVVARFGGDEFAMLLLGRASRAEIETAVTAIASAIAEPLLIDGREIFMTASIGVALADRTYSTVEQVLRDADTAMYYAKTAGRSRHAFFDKEMHEQAARRLEIATQLRRALDRDQFFLAYQPVVSLGNGAYEACEALLRWEHPNLGTVSPAEFIPIAEEIGMIVPIGRFVVERACSQLRDWKVRGSLERRPRLSVNASVREVLQIDYPAFIESMVEKYQIEHGQLTIEVTESTVLASGRFSSGALDRIKAAGVGLSIDDFGTGYSSLRYLQQFPFDELKIDRSFVSGADGGLASEAIVAMLLSLGRAFGVAVTAEGVETAAQASRLRALGCTRAQGYLYGKPVRAEQLADVFRTASPFAS